MENLENQSAGVVKTTDWLVTLLIASIPVVGFIMLFVWAFGSETNPNKSNWAKAGLLWMAILFVIYMLFAVVFGIAFFASQA